MERPKNFMDLFDLIKIAGRLNENVANEIFSQIVRTVVDLYYKHSIIHRDVKDENIILDMDTGKTWLCDFGAAEFKNRIISKQFHGTRSYCPPEVFEIQRFLPLEGTIWSLGILLYTMLIGHPPFQNVMHICAGKIRIPGYISKECRSLIENCLQLDPEKRLRLEQLSSHEWIVQSKTDYIVGGFSEMHKFWRRKGRLNSLGTSRTTESDSSEECSYRASTGRNEPEPISIPIRSYLNNQQPKPMTQHCLSIESTCKRPDSGFDTCSEGPVLRQSFNGSPSLSTNSSQNLFCSLCSSSYYTVDGRQSFDDDSPRGSLISSAYFSTSSAITLGFREMNYSPKDEDLTIIEDHPKITNRNDPRKWSPPDDEGELTIIEEHPKITNRNDPRKLSKIEFDLSSDEDETMILSANVKI